MADVMNDCGPEVARGATYREALAEARDLIVDGGNAEYTRGVLELLARTYGKPGMLTVERVDEIAAELGLGSTQ